MTSVEGMWQFQSSSIDEPDALKWGGIVVLESGHVLGGDSVMAYVGTYEVDRSDIIARVRSWSWNNDVGPAINVFGMPTPIDHRVVFYGKRNGNVIEGHLEREGEQNFRLPARMEKLADVP